MIIVGRPVVSVRPRRAILPRVRVDSGAFAGLAILVIMIVAALCGSLFPARPEAVSMTHILEPPSYQFPMGTDNLGRDEFIRVVYGGRVSLSVALYVAIASLAVGVPLGLVGGFARGAIDRVLLAVMDVLMAFPALLLAISIASALGQGLATAVIAIAVIQIPRFQRLTRAQVLAVSQLEYVIAAQAVGANTLQLLVRHILPNISAPLIVQLSLAASFAILAEAGLSFLGLSEPPPTPAWGSMLNSGRGYLEQAPWMSIFPGLAIALTVLAFNILGDALRDALDPRLRGSNRAR